MAISMAATAISAALHRGVQVASTSSSSLCPPVGWMSLPRRNLSSALGFMKVQKSGVRSLVGNGRTLAITATLAAEIEEETDKLNLPELKADLLASVAGLDRGLVATKDDEEAADTFARKLETAGGGVELPKDLDKLQGRWRLIFSSGFYTGSLGGARPGPTISRLPLLSIGLVHQRIDVANRELDNIVDVNLPAPWPIPPIQLTATLAHSFEVVDDSAIKIIFEKTTIKPMGSLSSLPPVDLPQIQIPDFVRTPRNIRSGEFTTTFLDKDLRISRGDRGELRIFVRA